MVNVRKYTTWMVWDIVGSRLSIHHQLNVYTYIIYLYIICSPFIHIHLCYGYTVISLLFPEQWSLYYQPEQCLKFPIHVHCLMPPKLVTPQEINISHLGKLGKSSSNMPEIRGILVNPLRDILVIPVIPKKLSSSKFPGGSSQAIPIPRKRTCAPFHPPSITWSEAKAKSWPEISSSLKVPSKNWLVVEPTHLKNMSQIG